MPSPIFFLAMATMLSALAIAGWQYKRARDAQESNSNDGENRA